VGAWHAEKSNQFKRIKSKSKALVQLLGRLFHYGKVSWLLYHTIDINYMPIIYIKLDKDQMLWMLSMMKKCFQSHNARLIVNKNLDHRNTHIIWDLICKAYNSSMMAELKAQQILTWLAQTQLHTNN
jgi:hypothetical protein